MMARRERIMDQFKVQAQLNLIHVFSLFSYIKPVSELKQSTPARSDSPDTPSSVRLWPNRSQSAEMVLV